MTLLTPLGLLGLLGIAVLILIYILRPNYQQKTISSTHIWKLSLKYKKKKIPISKLRNILLIICQILILTSCALILAQPNKVLQIQSQEQETVFVIDSSASMRTKLGKETRFQKAVNSVMARMEEVYKNGGACSVILAAETPEFIERHTPAERSEEALKNVKTLLANNTVCSYGEENIDGAMTAASELLVENPDAKVVVYTDTDYDSVPAEVELVNVADAKEWNAAVLSVETLYEEGYYTFMVDVAVYGSTDMHVDVNLRVYGMNAKDSNDDLAADADFRLTVYCDYEQTKHVIFLPQVIYDNDPTYYDEYFDACYTFDVGDEVSAYQSIYLSLHEQGDTMLIADSLDVDNFFEIFNGQKQVLKVQYASVLPNKFIPAMLSSLAQEYEEHWDIQVTRVKQGNTPATKGFDWYIFEDYSGASVMPSELPTDGIVMLINPLTAPTGSGLNNPRELGFSKEAYFQQEITHPIMEGVVADELFATRISTMNYNAYETLMTVQAQGNSFPVLSVKNEPTEKIVVLGFSLNFSNLAISVKNYAYLMNNIFQYFFPSTVNENFFEVGETVELLARGEELTVTHTSDVAGGGTIFEEFPASFKVTLPGTYTMTQTLPFKDANGNEQTQTDKVFVKAPSAESNIFKQGERLLNPYTIKEEVDFFEDLLVYVAAALVALLFLEWFLAGKEQG